MSTSKTVIQHIASIMLARKNCLDRMEQPLAGDAERWYRRHGAALATLLDEKLPSGSGIDSGVSLDYERTDVDAERFVFDVPFHVMNDAGYYVGWASYRVTVTPSFIGGMSLECERVESSGDEDAEYGLDEQIGETMHDALAAEFVIPAHYYGEG